jgi:hypothetical protein
MGIHSDIIQIERIKGLLFERKTNNSYIKYNNITQQGRKKQMTSNKIPSSMPFNQNAHKDVKETPKTEVEKQNQPTDVNTPPETSMNCFSDSWFDGFPFGGCDSFNGLNRI